MTQVVIDDIIPRTQLIATGGQTVFNTNWTADEDTDILVYARAQGVDPDDATQVVSASLYNVTFIGGSETVRVTFLSGRVLGDVITIVRDTPADRQNLYINTNFTPSMLNQDFGILTLVDQQAQMYDTVVNPGYNISATIDDKDKVLPILGAQQVWRMNVDNTGFEPYTIDSTPASSDAPFVTYTSDTTLDNEFNLGALASGILKQTVSSGVSTPAIATLGADYYGPGQSVDIPIIEGGTGASTASAARTNLGLGTMAVQNANAVSITGGSALLTSGTVATSPVNGTDLVNKTYVDALATGITVQGACYSGTTANLSGYTYLNGASGVGATLTGGSNIAFSTDSVSPALNARILVKNQSSTFQNGIYTLTTVGSGSTPPVLTRALDYNLPSQIQPGDLIVITAGATLASSSWLETATVTTIGTDPIVFAQFSATLPITVPNGGTGLTTLTNSGIMYATGTTSMGQITPVNNAVVVTNGSGVPTESTTLPSGLTIPGYALTASSVASITGTANQIIASASTGAVTLSTPQDIATTSTPSFANVKQGYTTTATAAGTTTLTTSSNRQQYFTGITTQIVQMPVTSTLVLGQSWTIVNLSTGIVTVNSSGSNAIITLNANTQATITCILTSGTTASSWSASSGSLASGSPVKSLVSQIFSASGTYTPTTGMVYAVVRAVGGGGAGGGAAGGAGQIAVGAGGGSGGYSEGVVTAAAIGASQTVTIGAAGTSPGAIAGNNGGDTSLGSIVIAKGGSGGASGAASASLSFAAGGSGGVTGAGVTATAVGNPGGYGFTIATTFGSSGAGGSSSFGGAAKQIIATAGANIGNSASNYGSGGGGGVSQGVVNSNGGNGSAGFLIIIEYVS